MTAAQITALASVLGSLFGAIAAAIHAYRANMAEQAARMHASQASRAAASSSEQPPQ